MSAPYVWPYQYNSLLTTSPVLYTEDWSDLSNWTVTSTLPSNVGVDNGSLKITWGNVTPVWDDVTDTAIHVEYDTSVRDSFVIETFVSGNQTMGLSYSPTWPFVSNYAFRLYYDGAKIVCDYNDTTGFVVIAEVTVFISKLRIRKSLSNVWFDYSVNGTDWVNITSYAFPSTLPSSVGVFAMGDPNGNIKIDDTEIGYWLRGNIGSFTADWYFNPQTELLECLNTGFYPDALYWTTTYDRTTACSTYITNYEGGLFSCWNEGLGNGYLLETDSNTQTGTFYRVTSNTPTSLTTFTLPTDNQEYEIGIGYNNTYIIGWIKYDGNTEELFLISDNTYLTGYIGILGRYTYTYNASDQVLVYDVHAVPNMVFRHTTCKKTSNQDFIVEQTYDDYQDFATQLDGIESTIVSNQTITDSLPDTLTTFDNLTNVGFVNGEYYIPGDWDLSGITALKEIYGDKWTDQFEHPWILVWKHTTETLTYSNTCRPVNGSYVNNDYVSIGGIRPEGVTEILFWWIYGNPSLAIQQILESWNLLEDEINTIFDKTSDADLGITVYNFTEPEEILEIGESFGDNELPDSINPEITIDNTIDYVSTLPIEESGDMFDWNLPPLDSYDDDENVPTDVADLIDDCYSNIKRAWKMVSITFSKDSWWKQTVALLTNLQTLTDIDPSISTLVEGYADNIDVMLDNITNAVELYKNITCISINSLTKLTEALSDFNFVDSTEELENAIDNLEDLTVQLPQTILDNINRALSIGNFTNSFLDNSVLQTLKYEAEHMRDTVESITTNTSCETDSNTLVNNATASFDNALDQEARDEYTFLKNLGF